MSSHFLDEECLFDCTKCGWIGTDKQKTKIKSKSLAELDVDGFDYVCQQCNHDEFYIKNQVTRLPIK